MTHLRARTGPFSDLRAILWMVASMTAFAGADLFIALATAPRAEGTPMTPGAMVVLQGVALVLLFGIWAWVSGRPVTGNMVRDRAVLGRTVGEMLGVGSFVVALAYGDFVTVSAILQIQPLAAVLLAVPFLGEPLARRQAIAIGLGMLGAMLVIRPGGTVFDPASLIAFGAVLGLSLRDLATRKVGGLYHPIPLTAIVGVALVPTGLAITLLTGDVIAFPSFRAFAIGLIAAVVGSIGFYAITVALRLGSVASIAPFRYVRLAVALLLAVAILDAWPDALAWFGCSLVALAGIYALRFR